STGSRAADRRSLYPRHRTPLWRPKRPVLPVTGASHVTQWLGCSRGNRRCAPVCRVRTGNIRRGPGQPVRMRESPVEPGSGVARGDRLMVADHLGDDEVEELLRELRVETGVVGEGPQAGDLALLAGGV